MDFQLKMLFVTLVAISFFVSTLDGAACSKYGNLLGQKIRNSKNRTKTVVFKYRFQKNFVDQAKPTVLAAMKEWTDNTCLEFQESDSPDAVLLTSGYGVPSFEIDDVYNRVTRLNLKKSPRFTHQALHMLGHMVGLTNENNRPDRDDYLSVYLENAVPEKRSSFDKFTWNRLGGAIVPYDYRSIMHFTAMDFSANGKPVLVTKDPAFQDVIGKWERISFGDVKTVSMMYACQHTNPECKKHHVSCPGEGFVSKDCQCLCPGDRTKPCPDDPTKACPGDPTKPCPETPDSADYNSGSTDYNSGSTDYNSGSTDYDSGSTDYNSGSTDYDNGSTDYNSGSTDYNSGSTDYDSGSQDYNSETVLYY